MISLSEFEGHICDLNFGTAYAQSVNNS